MTSGAVGDSLTCTRARHWGIEGGFLQLSLSSGCFTAEFSESVIEIVYYYNAPPWEINSLSLLLFQFQRLQHNYQIISLLSSSLSV